MQLRKALCPGPLFPFGLQPHEQATVCLVSSPQTTRPSGSLAPFLSCFNFSVRDTRKSPCSPTPLWFCPCPMLEHRLSCPCHDGTGDTHKGSRQTAAWSFLLSATQTPGGARVSSSPRVELQGAEPLLKDPLYSFFLSNLSLIYQSLRVLSSLGQHTKSHT